MTPPPPAYPGQPVGGPFKPGMLVWLYQLDGTPRLARPVRILAVRRWGDQVDVQWRPAPEAVPRWHNAQFVVAMSGEAQP